MFRWNWNLHVACYVFSSCLSVRHLPFDVEIGNASSAAPVQGFAGDICFKQIYASLNNYQKTSIKLQEFLAPLFTVSKSSTRKRPTILPSKSFPTHQRLVKSAFHKNRIGIKYTFMKLPFHSFFNVHSTHLTYGTTAMARFVDNRIGPILTLYKFQDLTKNRFTWNVSPSLHVGIKGWKNVQCLDTLL